MTFDGTDQSDIVKHLEKPSNPHKLCVLFKKTWNPKSQIVVYKLFDIYLSTHLLDMYKILMQEYHDGDRLLLFGTHVLAGFAHGAYIAQALAGMLSKVGLLKEEYRDYFSLIWGWRQSQALGIIFINLFPLQMVTRPFCHIGPPIFYQNELERSIWEQSIPEDGNLRSSNTLETDIKEVWFIGTHSDVGGGWMARESDHAISNISLRWMIQELVAAGHHDLF
ncbi:hypothetical protein BGW80DRAFT_1247620 [Lactifluus volemus]|nr:hypothetical protein BGW80DRAFT_1247620 [Lactifluus volemus]